MIQPSAQARAHKLFPFHRNIESVRVALKRNFGLEV